MAYTRVYCRCEQCGGDGSVTTYLNGEATGSMQCPACLGTGKRQVTEVDLEDTITSIGDILDKCIDIKEVVDEIKAKVDTL